MNVQLQKLIDEYFPDDKIKAECFLRSFSTGITKELEKYADSQYRKYISSTNSSIKNDPWVLGTSEGTDYCIDIIKKMLDE